MATPQLAVVPSTDIPETPGERLRRLKLEARQAAVDQVAALEKQLGELDLMAREILDGGDAYPVGVRELSRHLIEEVRVTTRTLEVIMQRNGLDH